MSEQDEKIYIGMDFNSYPMTTVVAVKVGDELHIVDELSDRLKNDT